MTQSQVRFYFALFALALATASLAGNVYLLLSLME